MTLDPYLTNVIASIRQDVRWSTIEVWKENKFKVSQNDAYGRTAAITSGARYFSGSLGWVRTREKQFTPGGSYSTGDCNISAAISAKTGSGIALTDDNIYLVAEGVKLNIIKIVDARETKDILITCERMGE